MCGVALASLSWTLAGVEVLSKMFGWFPKGARTLGMVTVGGRLDGPFCREGRLRLCGGSVSRPCAKLHAFPPIAKSELPDVRFSPFERLPSSASKAYACAPRMFLSRASVGAPTPDLGRPRRPAEKSLRRVKSGLVAEGGRGANWPPPPIGVNDVMLGSGEGGDGLKLGETWGEFRRAKRGG